MAQSDDFDLRDPFDSRGYQQGIVELLQALRTDHGPEVVQALYRYAPIPGDLSPVVTRTYARELRHHWRTFCEGAPQGEPSSIADNLRMMARYMEPRRSADAHALLEYGRAIRIALVMEEMEAKFKEALRTSAMLERAEKDGSPFVLLLRGFHYGHVLEVVLGGRDHLGEQLLRSQLSTKLDPTPLAYINEPAESIAASVEQSGPPGYRITADDDWQDRVALLLERAAAVALVASKPSDSIRAERDLITKADRWPDTVVVGDGVEVDARATRLSEKTSTDDLAAALKDRLAHTKASRRPISGKPVPCAALWLSGDARAEAAQNIDRLEDFTREMARRGVRTHFQVMLDTHYAILGNALMLERLDLVCRTFQTIMRTYAGFQKVVDGGPPDLVDALCNMAAHCDRLVPILHQLQYNFQNTADAGSLVDANLTVFREAQSRPHPETIQKLHFEMGARAAQMGLQSMEIGGSLFDDTQTTLADIRQHFDTVAGEPPARTGDGDPGSS